MSNAQDGLDSGFAVILRQLTIRMWHPDAAKQVSGFGARQGI